MEIWYVLLPLTCACQTDGWVSDKALWLTEQESSCLDSGVITKAHKYVLISEYFPFKVCVK